MTGLTTHVLDTTSGKPAPGVYYRLFKLGNGRLELLNGRTNPDGRCDGPMLDEESMQAGQYELVFHVAEYFADRA